MPFTYSITAGIAPGFVAYVLIKAVRGKAASVHPLMWLIAFLFVLYFAIDPIKDPARGLRHVPADVPGPTFPEHHPGTPQLAADHRYTCGPLRVIFQIGRSRARR